VHRYHFYLLGEEGEILGVVDREFADDQAAVEHARSLLPDCVSVDLLRGALVLGLVERQPHDLPFNPPPKRRRRWLFTACRPPKWPAANEARGQARKSGFGTRQIGRS